MTIFTLTLVRHGETGHNKSRVIQGQLDIALSATGIKQAKLLGDHMRHETLTHVYASDLSRAKQTAEEIVKCNLFFKGDVICDPRLRERKFGELQGKEFGTLKEYAAKANTSLFNYCPPGGETLKELRQRASSFFKSLCEDMVSSQKIVDGQVKRHEQQQEDGQSCHSAVGSPNVVVVSHGGLILELLHHLIEDLNCKVSGQKSQVLRISPNAAISKFRVTVDENSELVDMVCLLIHCTDHLTSQSKANAATGEDLSL